MFEVVDKNKRKSVFIIFLVFLILCVVIYFISYALGYGADVAIPFALIVSILSVWFSYYNSDKIVLASCKARPADPETEKKVTMAMESLIIASGLPMPRVYVVEDTAPNAFATGRNPEHAVVCVTTGLLEKLNYYELEGVLAHELAHIKNYDMLVSTIVSVMVGMIVLLGDIFTRMAFRGNRRRSSDDNNGGPITAIIMIVGLIFLILSPIIGQLMQLALSRRREYLADATAVEFTRNPQGLMDALAKLDSDQEPLEVANKATANMFIVNPLKGEGKMKKLFSTHPPIEERIEALRNIR